MRRLSLCFVAALLTATGVRAAEISDGLIWVEGGAFKHTKSNFHGKGVVLPGFYLGRCEVTQKEWTEVMGANPSTFKGDALPVETVSWYDCIEYCNRRSAREGLQPCYAIEKSTPDPNNGNPDDDRKWTVTFRAGANGYRLPTEAEWEYAAGGGQRSKNSAYSGGDDIGRVAWFWQNAGDQPLAGLWNWPAVERNRNRTKPVGTKEPNELGLHDLSGNVREWCWDWFGPLENLQTVPRGNVRGEARVWKGGGWIGGDFCCEPSFRAGFEPHGTGSDQGFRVCRNK